MLYIQEEMRPDSGKKEEDREKKFDKESEEVKKVKGGEEKEPESRKLQKFQANERSIKRLPSFKQMIEFASSFWKFSYNFNLRQL